MKALEQRSIDTSSDAIVIKFQSVMASQPVPESEGRQFVEALIPLLVPTAVQKQRF